MILSDYNNVNIIGRGQGNVPGGSGKNSSARRGNEFLFRIPETPREETGKGTANVSAEEEFYKNQAAGQLIRSASQDGKELSREDLLSLLAEHREEILKKLKNGDTGVKIPIGSMLLTQEEWEKLLDSFDEVQEKIQEQTGEESGGAPPEKRPDTTVNGDKVLAPEDTGHDAIPLEELIGKTEAKGKTADDFEEQSMLTDEEDKEQI